MNLNHYTYRVTWSEEDQEHIGLCADFPSLSWLASTPEKALGGIRRVVSSVVADMKASGEAIPDALADKKYSGRFVVRVPPSVHRTLATEAAEQGVSINRLVSAKLAVKSYEQAITPQFPPKDQDRDRRPPRARSRGVTHPRR